MARDCNRHGNGTKGSKSHKGVRSRQSPIRGTVTPKNVGGRPDDD